MKNQTNNQNNSITNDIESVNQPGGTFKANCYYCSYNSRSLPYGRGHSI